MSSESERPGEMRSYGRILEVEIENALREIRRPAAGLFLSGLSAGLNVSFGALFMAMALTMQPSFPSTLVKQVVLANASAVGFVLVVLGQTELFTAHTTMGVLPVVNGRANLRDLGRLWGVIYAANLVGCAAFAGLVAVVGPPLGIVEPSAFGSLASSLLPYDWTTVVLSGVVAGWLMGLVTWLLAASRDATSQFLFVWIITAGIGLGPFHHALLGTTEVLGAMFLGQGVTLGEFGHFLLWTTVGNAVGGTVFVALLNYGHAVFRKEAPDVDVDPAEG